MQAREMIDFLRRSSAAIRAIGAAAVHLYGSAARDEVRPDSDVGLCVDYETDGDFSLIELIRLEQHLKNILLRDVDLTTREGLHPLLRADNERSSVRVF